MNKIVLIASFSLMMFSHMATAESEACDSKSSVEKIIQTELKKVESKKFSREELQSLYQGSSESGVILTLLNPQVFKRKVIMSSLAYDCHVNLREYLSEKDSADLESAQLSKENWAACVKGLYSGKLPRLAETILNCMN